MNESRPLPRAVARDSRNGNLRVPRDQITSYLRGNHLFSQCWRARYCQIELDNSDNVGNASFG